MPRHLFSLLAGTALVLLVSACGKPDDKAANTAPGNTGAAAEPAVRAAEPAQSTASANTGARQDDKDSRGDCGLINAQDIAEAFAGKITPLRFGSSGTLGSGCTIQLREGEEGQLVLQSENRATFEMRRDSAQSQSNAKLEVVDIGVEAHLINSAQVIAIDEHDRAVSIGLILIVFGTPLPVTSEESAAGVQLLARRMLERLQDGT